MGHMADRYQQIVDVTRRLKERHSLETDAFTRFIARAEAGKALDIKQKELINVALAVAAQCEWCIAFHTKNAIKAGATEDELIEAAYMAVIMHGGPAYMYMIPLMDAIDEFMPGD